MLTKRSSSLSKGKLLITLPLVAICLLCFTKNSFSGQRKWHGDTVTYNGNTIETAFPKDTMVMLDPKTGKNITKVTTLEEHRPTKLNGAKIYMSYEITTDNTLGKPLNERSALTDDVLKEYLLDNLKSEFKNLNDGKYYLDISNIVVNEKGKIVYFDYSGIEGIKEVNSPSHKVASIKISKDLQNVIGRKVEALINDAPLHAPAYINGEPVAYLVNGATFQNPFSIKNHKLVAE